MSARFHDITIDTVFENGLHEFIQDFISCNQQVAQAIERAYRFYA